MNTETLRATAEDSIVGFWGTKDTRILSIGRVVVDKTCIKGVTLVKVVEEETSSESGVEPWKVAVAVIVCLAAVFIVTGVVALIILCCLGCLGVEAVAGSSLIYANKSNKTKVKPVIQCQQCHS